MRPPKGLGQKWSSGEVVALVKGYPPGFHKGMGIDSNDKCGYGDASSQHIRNI